MALVPHCRTACWCRGGKLRAAVARALGARNAPQLLFRHDSPTPQQRSIEDILAQLDEEQRRDEEEAAGEQEEEEEEEAGQLGAAGGGEQPHPHERGSTAGGGEALPTKPSS